MNYGCFKVPVVSNIFVVVCRKNPQLDQLFTVMVAGYVTCIFLIRGPIYCFFSKSGCCCHVMATVWILDEYSRLNLTETPSSSITKSRTLKSQAWGIPNRKRTVVHKPVMETKLCRPMQARHRKLGKKEKTRTSVQPFRS